MNKILGMIPSDVESVLDTGCAGNIFNKKYKTITINVLENADIKMDLNRKQNLPLRDNSFDIVILNQILEHLTNVEKIIKESKRVSKKYILVVLPNELTWGFRIRFLIGKPAWEFYLPYWHKHFFTIKTVENFIKQFFEKDKTVRKEYLGALGRGKIFTMKNSGFFSKNFPSIFAKEIYYLVKIKK
ncbi:MAG: methionine biosynthesis protein MetW [Candidatus Pacearchaeota archaeon]